MNLQLNIISSKLSDDTVTDKSDKYQFINGHIVKYNKIKNITEHFDIVLSDGNAYIKLDDYYYTSAINVAFKCYCDSLVEGSNSSKSCSKIISSTRDVHNINKFSDVDIISILEFYNEFSVTPECKFTDKLILL